MTQPNKHKTKRRHPTPPPSPPLSQRAPARLSPLQAWLIHHAYVLLSSLGQFTRSPLPSFMTAAVIGIALALPAGLYLLLENARHISANWDGNVQISLYLHADIEAEQAETLANVLRQRPDIKEVHLVTPEQALEEYKQLSGFKEALAALEDNPLPSLLVIRPSLSDADSAQSLVASLQGFPEVELAQFDMRWLQRLFAMMDMVQRGVLTLAALLGLAVLLIVGNTIRLAIYNRRDEIEINKLFGATDAFIRRPFLYSGFWHGVIGALLAWLLLALAFHTLQAPVQQLAALYHSNYRLLSLDSGEIFKLLLIGAGLGLSGAWLAVSWHLRAIQPR